MALFLFEFVIDNLKRYVTDDQKFHVCAAFADVFDITLRSPTSGQRAKSSIVKKKKRKALRMPARTDDEGSPEAVLEMGHIILFESDIDALKRKMENNPLQLTIQENNYTLGTTVVPWGPQYFNYLNELHQKQGTSTVVTNSHKIYHDITSKIMVSLKISIKISHLRNSPSLNPDIEDTLPELQFSNDLPDKEPTDIRIKNLSDTCKESQTTCKRSHEIYKESTDTYLESDIFYGSSDTYTLSSHVYRELSELYKGLSSHCKEVRTGVSSESSLISIGQNIFAEDEIESLTYKEIHRPIDLLMLSLRKSTQALINRTNPKPLLPTVRSRSIDSIYNSLENQLKHTIPVPNAPKFGNRDYYVGFFGLKRKKDKKRQKKEKNEAQSSGVKMQEDKKQDTMQDNESNKKSSPNPEDETFYKFKICDDTCHMKEAGTVYKTISQISLDLPQAAKELISVTKCDRVKCDERKIVNRELASTDDRTLVNLDTKGTCEQCSGKKKEKPCFCTCECRFGFHKKTLYCQICGGYESVGDDFVANPKGKKPLPFPCPVYHKLNDKAPIPSGSTSAPKVSKSSKGSKSPKGSKQLEAEGKKKGVKKNKFKFKVGFEGIPPKIGHSKCVLPCGTMMPVTPVPVDKGWFWNADNIIGFKVDPQWRPGACHKLVAKLLRGARCADQLPRRRRIIVQSEPKFRSLITVEKKRGEFIIQLENMKKYNKPRLPNQQPFEDKEPLTFTVGKTEVEKLVRQKQKQRRAILLEHEQRVFIQMQFRNMCHKVCLKTYEQALNMIPGTEDPEVEPVDETLPPCTCSEDELSSEDTDEDEWKLQFSPPIALYKPHHVTVKINTSNKSTQYSYLDYKVNLYDKSGNPVPRFFTGPNGNTECSDLGGFWGPNHKWLEINRDGFIAEDGRWAPSSFLGPNNEKIDVDDPIFQTDNGLTLRIGVDGYIDSNNRWVFYKPPRSDKNAHKNMLRPQGHQNKPGQQQEHLKKPDLNVPPGISKKVQANLSPSTPGFYCYGDASPSYLSKLGISGHGHDKKILQDILREMAANGIPIRIPNFEIPHFNRSGRKAQQQSYFIDDFICRHPAPSEKGIIDVDQYGRKTYFTYKSRSGKQSKRRIAELVKYGHKLKPFHIPCMDSFINANTMKQKQYQHILEHNAKVLHY